MQKLLAIDAGGTSTRAVILDGSGRCLGYGRSGPGNPLSGGFTAAVSSLGAAAEAAERQAAERSGTLASALVAMAGASTQTDPEPFRKRLAGAGLAGALVIESDLLAVFFSGTFQLSGYALVAGTGAVAARIMSGRLDAVGDGMGWLLGDSGSGYWIGHRVVRAVAAALDGRGPRTALTPALLQTLGIRASATAGDHGRPAALQQLIHELYALRPVQLSRFAPLAFQASDDGDGPARTILAEAGEELAQTLGAVRDTSVAGPVVLGGSILRHGSALAERVEESLSEAGAGRRPIRVSDGVAGAAVLALMRAGISVDAEIFARIHRTLAALRTD